MSNYKAKRHDNKAFKLIISLQITKLIINKIPLPQIK